MTALVYIVMSMVLGSGAAVQSSMLASLGRMKAPVEAAWISILATVAGAAFILMARAVRNGNVSLPSPLDRPAVLVVIGVAMLVTLVLSIRGLPLYYAGTGLFGLAFLSGAAFLVPKIGISVFVSAQIAGTLITAVILDHFGVLGAASHHVSFARIAGVGALLTGVLLIRGLD